MAGKNSKLTCIKPLSAAIGAAFVGSLVLTSAASAEANPFGMQDLNSGYMVAGGEHGGDKGEEGKCGEGKCGGDKGEEGSCGGDKGEEGSCGGDKGEEGKCGEGKCGGDKGKEGECGGDKGEEGSCGGRA